MEDAANARHHANLHVKLHAQWQTRAARTNTNL